MKEDSRSFYSGMEEIQEFGRRFSEIGKKKFLGPEKKFAAYIQDVLKVLIKNTQSEIKEVHKIYSERGFKKFL